MITLIQNAIVQYPDGSKCSEFIADLAKRDTMTWEAVYWRAKYLFEHAGDLCTTQELIGHVNACFNQGLSVNANRDCYIDARRMAAALYNKAEQYEFAANCIQVVLDITDDLPVDMFLDLTFAEVHTDTLRQILKNSSMFFSDLHMADGKGEQYLERQKAIIRELLLVAADLKAKKPDTVINSSKIESEVASFGLTNCDEWIYFKQMLGGAVGTKKPTPVRIPATKTSSVIPTEQPAPPIPKKKDRPLEIPIFPEDEDPAKVAAPKSPPKEENKPEIKPESTRQGVLNLQAFEAMLAPIMGLVKANAEQIAVLQGKLGESKDASETAKIEAELQDGRAKNQELLQQLEAVQAQLALSEEQRQELRKKIDEQALIIDVRRNTQFTEDELNAFSAFDSVILFDTCSIEKQLDLLDYIQPNEMVRISQTVIDELEHHKKSGDVERQMMGQRALKAIRGQKCSVAFDFEHAYPHLLPKAYQIKEDDNIGTKNDKYIFSAALRYKAHTSLRVVLISDDVTMQAMAMSEHIVTMTAGEFITGREKVVPYIAPLSKEAFLAQKLKIRDYSLNPSEVLVLQSYNVFTYGDFIAKSEDEVGFMRARNGINLGNRLLSIRRKLVADFERKYGDMNSEGVE